jgi:hypothetical protein
MAYVPGLSKSRFQAGLQCPKRLWLECYRRELMDPIDEAKRALFDTGHRVGELAQQRFPGGVLLTEDFRQSAAALETTARLLGDGATCLYEPAFRYEGVLTRVDVLRKGVAADQGAVGAPLTGAPLTGRPPAGDWQLIEVKSSTQVKPEYVTDAAIQTYVVRGAGTPVGGVYLMHLNKEYVYRGGAYDLEQLFVLDDITAQVEAYLPSIPDLLSEMKTMLAGACPEVSIGRRCENPYDCNFTGHCHSFLPEHPVTDLPRLRDDLLAELLGQGLYSTRDIPLSHPGLDANQRAVCQVVQAGEPCFGEGMAAEFAGLEFPLHFLDFETVMPALPLYAGTRPFQTIPVQWSCHTLHEDGTLEHHEFIHREKTDPRPLLTERLLSVLAGPGTVVAYSPFEVTRLKELAEALPDNAAAIADVQDRLFDLAKVIGRYVQHPDFHGSASLKRVLPALVEDLSYEGLAVSNGEVAMLRYGEAVWGDLPEVERAAIFEDLLRYCAVDTLGMVRVFQELERNC